jgi:hypothetical protein
MRELRELKLNDRAKQLNAKLTLCRLVSSFLKKKAWKTIIQPLIDEMIADTIGGKRGNIYRNNLLAKPEAQNKEYLIGYKQALMDLNNRIWSYPESIEPLQGQIKLLEERAKAPDRYNIPMEEV